MMSQLGDPCSDAGVTTIDNLQQAAPPPFIGREKEIETIIASLESSPVLVVLGAVGVGKSRLADALAARVAEEGHFQVTSIACRQGDLGKALVSRCERAMNKMPGSLHLVLEREARLVIVDDAHHLPEVDVSALVSAFLDRPGLGRLLLVSREWLPVPRGAQSFLLELDGLGANEAEGLWKHLQDTYGPVDREKFRAALERTRGMPLAMRREYARARHGEEAWELESLSAEKRRVLEALCVLRLPSGPAAIAALLENEKVESTLLQLVSQQLIDPLAGGRFVVHDVVRDQIIAAMDSDWRRQLEARAADLISGMGRGSGAVRPAWLAGDDGALTLTHPMDRLRESVVHDIAAGRKEQAVKALVQFSKGALARGASGEILALIDAVEQAGGSCKELRQIRAEVAVRRGEVAHALEFAEELSPAQRWYLCYRAGQLDEARENLQRLIDGDDSEAAAQASAWLGEIEILSGDADHCERLLNRSFAARNELSQETRALLHLAFAQFEVQRADYAGARAALSRASSTATDAEIRARVEVRKVGCLIAEGRELEAENLLRAAKSAVSEIDCGSLADELARCQAWMQSRTGNLADACAALLQIAISARDRGDEVGALQCDLMRSQLLIACGNGPEAAKVANLLRDAAASTGLLRIVAGANLVMARVLLNEKRLEPAEALLGDIPEAHLSAWQQGEAKRLLREIHARSGRDWESSESSPLELAVVQLASGQGAPSLQNAREAARVAERSQLPSQLAESLAIVARLELSRGDRGAASSAAGRAVRAALKAGHLRSKVDCWLILAALARDEDRPREAATYARDAREAAMSAGLVVQQIVAERALEVISGGDLPNEIEHRAASANASKNALREAEALLSDLGFAKFRPFRCVDGNGVESFVASASPELLGMGERTLAIDGVQQIIFRAGEQVADLRRRSLLKRLLFLFAKAPGKVFSKEEIVEKVWEVEYHPLRHDAALFTNIMRIRRLLGDDGNELIAVSEDGYSLVPPKDFLYVEHTVAT